MPREKSTGSKDTDALASLSDLYLIYAIAFDYPDRTLADALAGGAFADDLIDCLVSLGFSPENAQEVKAGMEAFSQSLSAAELHDALKKEHSRLYSNMARPVVWIYETMREREGEKQLSQLFVSPACLHVENSMKSAGVSLEPCNKQPADYLPNELRFMSYLCAQMSQAAGNEDETPLDGCAWSEQGDRFFREHVSKWVGTFMRQTEERTKLAFYAIMAKCFLRLAVLAAVPSAVRVSCTGLNGNDV